MPILFLRTVVSVTLALLSAGLTLGCESDADKLTRLDSERLTTCLHADILGRAMTDANLNRSTTPYSDTLGKQWRQAKTDCQLATREYNRFMR